MANVVYKEQKEKERGVCRYSGKSTNYMSTCINSGT